MSDGGDKKGKKPNALVTAYLFLYNIANAVGWAWVLFLVAEAVFVKGLVPAAGYKTFEKQLLVVQSLAAMEIVHSLLRFVSSPVFTTFLQVFSRYAVLWGFTYLFPQAQEHWSLYLMVGSWSLVEVPRYLFYAVNLYVATVPYPLFWLRYSLFAILYPSGISGEILQILCALPVLLQRGNIAGWYATLFLLFLYVPGSPTMFGHMVTQRKKQFAARAEKGKPAAAAVESEGVDFPLDAATGQRSTTIVNQGAVAASLAVASKEAAAKAGAEKNWRFGYAKHFVKNVELSCASDKQCLAMAKAGLDYLHQNFEFAQKGSAGKKTLTVMEAMDKFADAPAFADSYLVEGTKARPANFEYSVPYQQFLKKEVNNLRGGALLAQLDEWVKRGTIEQDARDAVANMVTHPEYHGDALKNKWFVLLGAGSAMGPLRVLLELGCNIIAIDIDRADVWQRLITMARNSPGKMLFPVKKPKKDIKNDEELFAAAGADLLKQTPQIATWIKAQVPKAQLVLGSYAYLDSALFVRLAIAMDAIAVKVMEARKDTALAFLCSPTDVFVCDKACRDAMVKNRKKVPLWQSLLKLVTPKTMLVDNALPVVKADDGEEFCIVDGLAVAQGPNYALAKRLQHWRCMLARSQGHTVSTNIAPSTATESVVGRNINFRAGMMGFAAFPPLEVVYQDLSNSVMTALLLNDLCDKASPANPNNTAGRKLSNNISLFASTAAHFGVWRIPFKVGSIGEVSAMIGFAQIYSAYLYIALAATVGFIGIVVQKGAPHVWFK